MQIVHINKYIPEFCPGLKKFVSESCVVDKNCDFQWKSSIKFYSFVNLFQQQIDPKEKHTIKFLLITKFIIITYFSLIFESVKKPIWVNYSEKYCFWNLGFQVDIIKIRLILREINFFAFFSNVFVKFTRICLRKKSNYNLL